MKNTSAEILFLLHNLPYAAEVYDINGNIVEVNNAWRELFDYHKKILPQIKLGKTKLFKKTGKKDDLLKLLKSGKRIKTNSVLCEPGDIEYSTKGNYEFFKFYFFCLKDVEGTITHLVNLIEIVTDELKKKEIGEELELQKKEVTTSIDLLEEERKRVAQELHDVVGQKILLAKLGIELYQKKELVNADELRQSIDYLIDISKDIKSIIHSLHPVVIEKYNIIDALDLLVHEFIDRSKIITNIKYYGSPEYNNIKIDLTIYRIVQESLNNIFKHSQAENVNIECHFTDKMMVCSVIDNGIGFNFVETKNRKLIDYNYGLISMRERAKAFGGDLSVESAKGKGTKIFFQIPIGSDSGNN